jgi:hypothetical protein
MLQKDLKYIQDYVVSVDEDKITCKSGKVYEYDELISTAPAPIFWKLYDSKLDHLLQPKSKPEFKYLPITFVETWDKPLIYNDEFQMIYFFEEYTFTRLSKKEPSMYSYEFTGEIKNIKEYLPNCRITKINIQKIGRILPSKNEPPNANIKFLGRLSEWAFSSKIQDVIKTSIEYHNKVIINNQTHAK